MSIPDDAAHQALIESLRQPYPHACADCHALMHTAAAALVAERTRADQAEAEAEQLKADRNRLVDEWAKDGRVIDRALPSLRREMYEEARDLLGSGYVALYYEQAAAGFIGIAESYMARVVVAEGERADAATAQKDAALDMAGRLRAERDRARAGWDAANAGWRSAEGRADRLQQVVDALKTAIKTAENLCDAGNAAGFLAEFTYVCRLADGRAALGSATPALCGDTMHWAGYTNICTKPNGHVLPHASDEGTTWEPNPAPVDAPGEPL